MAEEEMFVSDDTHTSFTVHFFGTRLAVTVTSSSSAVDSWIRTTLSNNSDHVNNRRLVVGVGVEWNYYYPDGRGADTLQICVGTRCLIFQLGSAIEIPSLLRAFLLNTDHTFVGLCNSEDNHRLMANPRVNLKVHRLLDLSSYAVTKDGETLADDPVDEIVEEVLGFKGVLLEEEVNTSEWDELHLSDNHVLQASIDAHVSFLIGEKLSAWEF